MFFRTPKGGLKLRKIKRVLGYYLVGLYGRKFPLLPGKEAYTNTREIYLPESIGEFQEEKENFRMYKLTAHLKCEQALRGSLLELEPFLRPFPDKEMALFLYSLVEDTRLEYLITRKYRGASRELEMLRLRLWEKRMPREMEDKEAALEAMVQLLLAGKLKFNPPSHVLNVAREGYERIMKVRRLEATPSDSRRIAGELYYMLNSLRGGYPRRMGISYRGKIKPKEVKKALKLGVKKKEEPLGVDSRERSSLPSRVLSVLTKSFLGSMDINVDLGKSFKGRIDKLGKLARYRRLREHRGEAPVEETGSVPMDYSAPGSDGFFYGERMKTRYTYDEWDYKKEGYREGWCTIMEKRIRAGDSNLIKTVLEKHSALLKKIKRQFEALRREVRKMRRQYDGDEVDFDASVSYFTDIYAGATPDEKLYYRTQHRRRDVAVTFLIDQSNSTAGATLNIEKEALVLMSHALETLGDTYAIYGFSSNTRWECNFYRVQDFHESGHIEKIAGMKAGGYTRMGAAIRHASYKLAKVRARNKILMLLTDGYPLDYDGYDGRYALEDTRMAILEARRKRIHPFCITVDVEARDYLPRMFGEKSYVIINRVSKLPRKLPLFYARLTS
jgi:nitric oxide reductase NorD protein